MRLAWQLALEVVKDLKTRRQRWLLPRPLELQCDDLVRESVHNHHHLPGSLLAGLLGAAKAGAAIMLPNASLGVNREAHIAFAAIPHVHALTAQQIDAIEVTLLGQCFPAACKCQT